MSQHKIGVLNENWESEIGLVAEVNRPASVGGKGGNTSNNNGSRSKTPGGRTYTRSRSARPPSTGKQRVNLLATLKEQAQTENDGIARMRSSTSSLVMDNVNRLHSGVPVRQNMNNPGSSTNGNNNFRKSMTAHGATALVNAFSSFPRNSTTALTASGSAKPVALRDLPTGALQQLEKINPVTDGQHFIQNRFLVSERLLIEEELKTSVQLNPAMELEASDDLGYGVIDRDFLSGTMSRFESVKDTSSDHCYPGSISPNDSRSFDSPVPETVDGAHMHATTKFATEDLNPLAGHHNLSFDVVSGGGGMGARSSSSHRFFEPTYASLMSQINNNSGVSNSNYSENSVNNLHNVNSNNNASFSSSHAANGSLTSRSLADSEGGLHQGTVANVSNYSHGNYGVHNSYSHNYNVANSDSNNTSALPLSSNYQSAPSPQPMQTPQPPPHASSLRSLSTAPLPSSSSSASSSSAIPTNGPPLLSPANAPPPPPSRLSVTKMPSPVPNLSPMSLTLSENLFRDTSFPAGRGAGVMDGGGGKGALPPQESMSASKMMEVPSTLATPASAPMTNLITTNIINARRAGSSSRPSSEKRGGRADKGEGGGGGGGGGGGIDKRASGDGGNDSLRRSVQGALLMLSGGATVDEAMAVLAGKQGKQSHGGGGGGGGIGGGGIGGGGGARESPMRQSQALQGDVARRHSGNGGSTQNGHQTQPQQPQHRVINKSKSSSSSHGSASNTVTATSISNPSITAQSISMPPSLPPSAPPLPPSMHPNHMAQMPNGTAASHLLRFDTTTSPSSLSSAASPAHLPHPSTAAILSSAVQACLVQDEEDQKAVLSALLALEGVGGVVGTGELSGSGGMEGGNVREGSGYSTGKMRTGIESKNNYNNNNNSNNNSNVAITTSTTTASTIQSKATKNNNANKDNHASAYLNTLSPSVSPSVDTIVKNSVADNATVPPPSSSFSVSPSFPLTAPSSSSSAGNNAMVVQLSNMMSEQAAQIASLKQHSQGAADHMESDRDSNNGNSMGYDMHHLYQHHSNYHNNPNSHISMDSVNNTATIPLVSSAKAPLPISYTMMPPPSPPQQSPAAPPLLNTPTRARRISKAVAESSSSPPSGGMTCGDRVDGIQQSQPQLQQSQHPQQQLQMISINSPINATYLSTPHPPPTISPPHSSTPAPLASSSETIATLTSRVHSLEAIVSQLLAHKSIVDPSPTPPLSSISPSESHPATHLPSTSLTGVPLLVNNLQSTPSNAHASPEQVIQLKDQVATIISTQAELTAQQGRIVRSLEQLLICVTALVPVTGGGGGEENAVGGGGYGGGGGSGGGSNASAVHPDDIRKALRALHTEVRRVKAKTPTVITASVDFSEGGGGGGSSSNSNSSNNSNASNNVMSISTTNNINVTTNSNATSLSSSSPIVSSAAASATVQQHEMHIRQMMSSMHQINGVLSGSLAPALTAIKSQEAEIHSLKQLISSLMGKQ